MSRKQRKQKRPPICRVPGLSPRGAFVLSAVGSAVALLTWRSVPVAYDAVMFALALIGPALAAARRGAQ